MIFKLNISCVDGETFYSMGSNSREQLFKFLERYDHEGSSVSLDIFDLVNDNPVDTLENPDEIYNFLMRKI